MDILLFIEKNSLYCKVIRVLFRTAGGRAKGKELGLGHIYRSINLAKSLKPNKIYFLVEDYGGAKEILKKNGFSNIETIRENVKELQDYKKTELQIKKLKIDIVIIDRYKISKSYIKKLSKISKVVVISDLRDVSFNANLIVNGFVGFKNQIIKNKFDSKCMIGPNFQILNKEFSKKNKTASKKWDILISFGGYDEKGIMSKVTKILPHYLDKLKIKIILGPVARKNLELNKLQRKYPTNLDVKKSSNNMAKEMSDVKYGLCTGGLTTYEFASMKIPVGIISDDHHQVDTAKHWEKLGFAKNLGMINNSTIKKINLFLEEIYQGKAVFYNRKLVVDGNGAKRVSNEILKIK